MATARYAQQPVPPPPPQVVVLELSIDEACFLRGLVGVTSPSERRRLLSDEPQYSRAVKANDAGKGFDIFKALDQLLGVTG